MEVGLEDCEMLLGPVETCPDALPAQETSTNEDGVPRRLSSTSSGGGITNNAPIESNKPPTSASRSRAADPEIIQKVEAVVQQIVRSLQQEEGKVWISLRNRKRPGTSPSARSSRSPAQDQYKLSFPGETPEEAWRFSTAGLVEAVCSRTSSMLTCSPAVVLRILELIHEALVNDAVVSKRNIYYKDPELFKSQKVVDRYVDILSHTFGIQRAALNVTAAAKGLVAGSFTMTFHDSSTRSCNGAANAMLIDDVDDIRSVDISNVLWILVVEKESTFRTLDSCKTHENSRAGKGIILTAKGYPDVSTRVFLRLLSISSHPLPSIFALVDFDPDGISIMSTYKHGSANLAHENANVRCSTLRWLGVKSGDLNIATSNTGAFDDEADDIKGLLKLSKRDRKKAVGMLDQGICDEHGVEQEWRRELQVMLMVSLKAEMEILSQRDGGIERWVEDRLCEEMS